MEKRHAMNWSLDELYDELLSGEPGAILPANLSDEWLERLCAAADLAVDGCDSDRGHGEAFDAMMAIAARGIRAARTDEASPSLFLDGDCYLSLQELWMRVLEYRLALTRERGARMAGCASHEISLAGLFAPGRLGWQGGEAGSGEC